MALQTININKSASPATNKTFTLLQPTQTLGPTPVLNQGQTLAANVVPTTPTVNIATWNVMANFDAGLKAALINFIDTTKEGVKYPQVPQGRTKTINFTFQGSVTQSVAPGEMGIFSLSMSYPPGGNSLTAAPIAVNLSNLNSSSASNNIAASF